jgi:hypothetical protein
MQKSRQLTDGLARKTPMTTLDSAFGAGVPWVIRANMKRKFSVAPHLEVPHHFIKGIASGQARGVEHPSTFGATETAKTYFVDPYKPAGHPPFSAGL